MGSMIILTVVAVVLGLLLIGAVTFTLVGLHRRRVARDAHGADRPHGDI